MHLFATIASYSLGASSSHDIYQHLMLSKQIPTSVFQDETDMLKDNTVIVNDALSLLYMKDFQSISYGQRVERKET